MTTTVAHRLVPPLLGITLSAISAITALAPFVKHNITPSVPLGWYLMVPYLPIRTTDYEIGCLPAAAADFITRHHLNHTPGSCPGDIPPIIKRVLATAPSPLIRVTRAGVVIGSTLIPHTTPWPRLPDGTPLPTAPRHRLTGTQTFVIGDHPHSYDSRYWGPLANGMRAIPLVQHS